MCELGTLIFLCSALSLVESRQIADSSCVEFQCADKRFQSSYLAGGVMIVPVNRVAMAPRDLEELMNSTIIHRFHESDSHLCPKSSHGHQRHLHTSISYSSSCEAALKENVRQRPPTGKKG